MVSDLRSPPSIQLNYRPRYQPLDHPPQPSNRLQYNSQSLQIAPSEDQLRSNVQISPIGLPYPSSSLQYSSSLQNPLGSLHRSPTCLQSRSDTGNTERLQTYLQVGWETDIFCICFALFTLNALFKFL